MDQIFTIRDVYNSAAPYITLTLLFLVLILFIWTLALNSRLRKTVNHYQSLLKDSNTKNLQQVLDDQLAVMQETSDQLAALNTRYDELAFSVLKSLQQVGIVRFNPFRDMGGDQSFAIALMDAKSNGIVVSSLHSREATRLYAKPVIAGESPNSLSDEEIEAIARARGTGFV